MKQSIYPKLQDSDWLKDQIVNQGKNCAEIARELGISNRSAVNRAAKKFGLDKLVVRTKFPQLKDKEWLEQQLESKSITQVANELGTSTGNVACFMRSHNISLGTSKSENIKRALRLRYPNGSNGESASNWKGGRRIMNGYVRLYKPDHPNAIQGSIFEHRVVAEKTLGRYLEKDEIVHHINHNKQDNRPENLQVTKRGEHVTNHFKEGKRVALAELDVARLKSLLDKHHIKY